MRLPSEIITRNRYLDLLRPFIDKQVIKVLTGQRRVGKSFLLFQIMNEIKSNIPTATFIYINKEDLEYADIKNAEDLNQYVLKKVAEKGKTYVFIDEIQDIENFETALRSLLLHEKIDIYCTGSNAKLLASDIAGNLSGRFVEIQVYSLSYIEFLEFHGLKSERDSLEKYMKYGGLPYLKHLPLNEDVAFEYLKNIYSTIVYKDVVNRYHIRNTNFLERLVFFLASNTGSIFSSKSISDFLKSQKVQISHIQVQTYISHLENAFIILSARRYNLQGKRLLETGEKYYFENLGIRNALWGYRLEDRGKIVENIVHNHLRYLNYSVRIGVLGVYEIDFVAEKHGELIYIQVALELSSESTIQRELGNLMKIKDNYPKLVVTLDQFSGNTVDGIKLLQLSDFLLLEEFN
jgi:predicted AAA+ superfamily ATPase